VEQRDVEGLRERRPEVLDALLDRYGREIQSVAFLIVRDRADAEDITVETILTAWHRAGDLRDEASLRPWLLRIATNKSLTHRRRGARVVQLHVVPDIHARDTAPDSVARVTLLAGIATLPPQMRAALVLRYYADLSIDEVAAALGKSPNTIKAQLQTALDRLRIALADEDADRGEVRHA
jgi:RNA polymerase sigma factor (sigma-70 family)